MTSTSPYIIDTSALIDLEYWFRRETFPSIWDQLENLAAQGCLRCPREVDRELERQSVDLKKWIKQNGMVISVHESTLIAPIAAQVDQRYPELKKGKRRSRPNPRCADPWVVALALNCNGIVVCSESATPQAQAIRTIPDACRMENMRCLSLPEFFLELGIRL